MAEKRDDLDSRIADLIDIQSAELLDAKIAELEAQLAALATERNLLHDRLDQLRLAKVKRDQGIEIGSIVIYKRNGREYRITKIRPHFSGVWVSGNQRNKDGSWSKAERHLYDNWMLP